MRKVMARLSDGEVLQYALGEKLPEGSHAWEVEERVQWDDGGPQAARMIALVRRLPSLTREEFAEHWSERHTPLARRHHPALRRYVQNVVIRSLGDAPEIDGVAELWFDSEEDMKARFYDSPQGKEIIAEDVRRFIDRGAAPMTALEDRLEIDDLLTRYAVAIDTKQWDLLETVFTPDAFIDYTSAGGVKGSFPEVRQWLADVLAGFPMTQHLLANRHVTLEGDTATARSYFYNPMGTAGPDGKLNLFFVGGYYNDRLVRTPDGWRIVERIEETAWMQGAVPGNPS